MKVKSFLATVGVLAIPVTIILTTGWNPLVWVGNKVESTRTMSDPPTTWRTSMGNTPDWVQQAGPSILAVGGDELVTAVDVGSGARRWYSQVDFSAVAGSDETGGAVVIVGGVVYPDGHRSALEAREPYSGAVVWNDPDAVGAWTYANLVITLACPKSSGCTLTGRQPRTGTRLWSAGLPSGARSLHGANHAIAAFQSLLAPAVGAAPAVLGFPVDDSVYLVRTDNGHTLPTQKSSAASRLVAAGSGQLRIDADYVNGGCRYTLHWTDLVAGRAAWHSTYFQPRTADGATCEQRGDPAADGDLFYLVGAGRADTLLTPETGKIAYTAKDGERILGVGGAQPGKPTAVLVRTADGKSVSARALTTGAELWQEPLGGGITMSTNGSVATFVNVGTGQLVARRVADGSVAIRADTLSSLLGYAEDGLILNEALRVGLLRYGSVHA